MNCLQTTAHADLMKAADDLREKGRFQDALRYYQEALEKGADPYLAYLKLGETIQAQRNPHLMGLAQTYYQQALHLHPEKPAAYERLAILYQRVGNQAKALENLHRALELNSIRASFLTLEITCPILYETEAEIITTRQEYSRRLEALGATISLLNESEKAEAAQFVGIYPFFLAYQGFNDVALQQRRGQWVCTLQAARYPQWCQPLHVRPRKPDQPIRIGFVSGFFYHHATWNFILQGWLRALDPQQFDLYGYYTGYTFDACTEEARQRCVGFVSEDFSLSSLSQKIRKDDLDILIYPEIGMDTLVMRLAALRLAPVQCVSWGHSTTSGLPTMDYFLSSDLMEPPEGDSHYTEKLIRLPHLGGYLFPELQENAMVDVTRLGIKKEGVLYLCMQSLFKYLPQYDAVYPRIAREVGNCQFLFMTGRQARGVVDTLKRRLTTAFSLYGLDMNRYVVFLPRVADGEYASLYQRADVFLDSFGWSGCNTTMDAMRYHVPVVTMPGALMRGRQSFAILTRLGLTETIAHSVDEYIALAVKLGLHPQWRAHIRDYIATHAATLYQDTDCIEHLQQFIINAVNSSRPEEKE